MKQTITLTFLLFVFLSSFSQSSKKESQVWESVESLTHNVFGKRDSAALDAMVTSDVTYAHSTGLVENKKEMMRNALGSPTTYKNIEIERGAISIHKKTAILRHNLRGASVTNGTEAPLNLGVLQVWRKEGGRWKIAARQAVRIAPKS